MNEHQERVMQVEKFLAYLRGELMQADHFRVSYTRPNIVVGKGPAGEPIHTTGGGPVGVLTLVLMQDFDPPPPQPPTPPPQSQSGFLNMW